MVNWRRVMMALPATALLAGCVPYGGPGYYGGGYGYGPPSYAVPQYVPSPYPSPEAGYYPGQEVYVRQQYGGWQGGDYERRRDDSRQRYDNVQFGRQQQSYNQAVLARQQQHNAVVVQQQQHNNAVVAQQNAYNQALIAQRRAQGQ